MFDDKVKEIFDIAEEFYEKGDYIKALELIEDLSFVKEDHDRREIRYLQGKVFENLAENTQNTDLEFTYFLASAQTFSNESLLSSLAATTFFSVAHLIGSPLYYKKCLGKAKQCLLSTDISSEVGILKYLIENAELEIAKSETAIGYAVRECEQEAMEEKEHEETKKGDFDFVKGLRLYWAGLNIEKKREFMRVSIAELTSYAEELHGREGRDALEKVLTFSREERKWRFWMCRSCSEKFFSYEECKKHLEQEHVVEIILPASDTLPKRINKEWDRKISSGVWEPVDRVAAVEMINNRLEDVKAFVYDKGWSKEWPLAVADEERSKLLQEIRLLLMSFCELKILSCSVRDWVMSFVVEQLEKLDVSEEGLTLCRSLAGKPQIICFLECPELSQILEFLKSVKRERHDGKDIVCRAVDSFCIDTRVKEKIDFDTQFSLLLLDKRLLYSKIAGFDDEGKVEFIDPDVHNAKAHACGYDILSWLVDHSSGDGRFRFPRAIREHNLDIWAAVLKATQFAYRTEVKKYQNRFRLTYFLEALNAAKAECKCEDERRRSFPEEPWNKYAALICDKCEQFLTADTGRSKTSLLLLLSAMCDVLDEASYPTLYHIESKGCLTRIGDCIDFIRERKTLNDDTVLKSIDKLILVVTKKIPRIESKILLIQYSKISLLNDLTRLSVFDYRSYILRPLKEFLLDRIMDMECKAKLAAAEEDLLLEDEKKSQPKKKKPKSKKSNSTSKSSTLDKTVENKHSVNLESEIMSPSLTTAEEDSLREEDFLLSERDNQVKVAEDTPGEDSLSEHPESVHGEGPARCKSALGMTLKAICNIKSLREYLMHNQHQFPENVEEQVPAALQNFITAFVSKTMKEKGLYSYLLDNLLASLEKVHCMSSDAAELLVAILEFWPCWRSPQIESVVARLFTVEEYERMSCSRCRNKPNFPEQISYGVVLAADSIRDLKFAFGNIKFEDIVKVIRVEYKMLCDIKTGGCGKANIVHHVISTCPPIFTVVLKWEKNETEKEISETTKALDWEIDMSRLFEGIEPNTKYRLVSMVGYGEEEEEHICLAYRKERWVSFRDKASAKEVIGEWKNVIRFCEEKKIRPEIMFYEEALQWMS
ncbi:unnamed protein product [Cochlearia groenlandica]